MKDLFKGHHPWLLVLVIAVDIFSALVIRHSILPKENQNSMPMYSFLLSSLPDSLCMHCSSSLFPAKICH